MERLLAIVLILAAARVLNSEKSEYGSARPISIDSVTTEIVHFDANGYATEDKTEAYEHSSIFSTETHFQSTELIKKCDEKRTLNNCEEEGANTLKERAKHGNGELSSIRANEKGGKKVEKKGSYTLPTRPTTTVPKSFMEFKSKAIVEEVPDHQEKSKEDKIHDTSTIVNRVSKMEFEKVQSTKPTAAEAPESAQKLTVGKSSDKVSLPRPWDMQPTTLTGTENLVRIWNKTGEKMVSRRPKIHELMRLTNDSHNGSRQLTQVQSSFGTVRHVKPLDILDNSTTTQQSGSFLTFSTLLSSTFYNELKTFTESPGAFNGTRKNDTIDKFSQEIPWPVKKESIVEGDIILGGLMMVHEREDSITCGPVMPQGGIQALEAMLFTLDRLNSSPEPLLPNITLGAHILDDCDKDTYGLEMAVDFIKGTCDYLLLIY